MRPVRWCSSRGSPGSGSFHVSHPQEQAGDHAAEPTQSRDHPQEQAGDHAAEPTQSRGPSAALTLASALLGKET